jgi:6-phosphogluconolactonase
MKPRVHVHPDPQVLSGFVAERFAALCSAAVRVRGAFHVALAGGSTPRGLYERLARPPLQQQVDWGRTQVWFGDERCVPPDHPESNYRMARMSLLDHVRVPPEQVHAVPVQRPPEEAARDYGQLLRTRLPQENDTPILDLVLLGLGTDGHIASLFPGTAALEEESEPAVAVHVPRLGLLAWRVTLTRPVLEHARQLLILATGTEKAAVVHRALADGRGELPLPVQRLRPRGEAEWHIDRDAAALRDAQPPDRNRGH